MIVIRDLKDLMALDGVNNIGNKYRIVTESDRGVNSYSLQVKRSDIISGVYITLADGDREVYFTKPNIKTIVDILIDIGFEVEYRKDTNQEIVNDLIALIECINENNVNKYRGALKQIIERIDSLNQVKSRY